VRKWKVESREMNNGSGGVEFLHWGDYNSPLQIGKANREYGINDRLLDSRLRGNDKTRGNDKGKSESAGVYKERSKVCLLTRRIYG